MKIVIVDDEPFGREQVSYLIKKTFPGMTIAAEAATATEAINTIIHHQPDLVFLDIELPDGSGFDILEKLGEVDFEVIFITAHGHYALKAIKFSALDYLLKPINKTEFSIAVTKYLEKRKYNFDKKSILKNLKNNLNASTPELFRLAIHETGRTHFLKPNDIFRCEADGNYTRIFIKNKESLLSSKTLKEYDDILTEYHFIRIHRAHLVNKNYVKALNNHNELIMEDDSLVEVSRRKLAEIRTLLLA